MLQQSLLNYLFSQFILMIVMLVWILSSSRNIQAQQTGDIEKSKKIRISLEKIVTKEKIPGMVAAITDAKGIVAIESFGVRKAGFKSRFKEDDVVHIGSCTKAMTSMMLATLVDEGKLTWETTLIEVLPELKNKIHPDYYHITLWQLLTHRAGIRPNAKNWWSYQKKKLKERRLAILTENLKEAPVIKPGKYHYSNLGYLVAACLAEKRSNLTWESLMKKQIFHRLNMTSAGFGPPGSSSKFNRLWGHSKSQGQWQPKQSDNAPALGPAGRVHCKLEDWAKFLALLLSDKKKKIITRQQLDKMIKPNGHYSGGWMVMKRSWGKGNVLTHSGSNTMWYSTVWVAPKLNRAFIVATNSCDDNSHAICDKMITRLIAINRETHIEKESR